jgi:hypothetical protein
MLIQDTTRLQATICLRFNVRVYGSMMLLTRSDQG